MKNSIDFENQIRMLALRRSRELEQGSDGVSHLNLSNWMGRLVRREELEFEPTVSEYVPPRLFWLLRDWQICWVDLTSIFEVKVKCVRCINNGLAGDTMELDKQTGGWSKSLKLQQQGHAQLQRLKLVIHQSKCTVLFEARRRCTACLRSQCDGDGDLLRTLPPYIQHQFPFDPAFNIVGADVSSTKQVHRRSRILGRDITTVLGVRVTSGESWELGKVGIGQGHMISFEEAQEMWSSAVTQHSIQQGDNQRVNESFDTPDMHLRRSVLDLISISTEHFEDDFVKYVQNAAQFVEFATHVSGPVDLYLAVDGNRTMSKKIGPAGRDMWLVGVSAETKEVMAWTWSCGESGESIAELIKSLPSNFTVLVVSLDNIQSDEPRTGEKETKILQACLGRPGRNRGVTPEIFQDGWHPIKCLLAVFSQNHECFKRFKNLVKNVGSRLEPTILESVKNTLMSSECRQRMEGWFYAPSSPGASDRKKYEYSKLTRQQVSCLIV